MNWIKATLIGLIGYGFIFGVFGLLALLLLTPLSVYLNHSDIQTKNAALLRIQNLTYPYVRNMWNAQEECVTLDPVVVYKPALGSCTFTNAEFETVLTFTETGRVHPNPPAAGSPIAVIGDSHAMGWGVNDTETFSYHLQAHTQRPVYNLGVGSYATERSVRRLLALPDFDQIETIILQYGDNDLAENENFPIDPDHWVSVFKEKFSEGDLRSRSYLDKVRFTYPLVTTELLQRVVSIPAALLGFGGEDEGGGSQDHSTPLQTVLAAFGEDLAGRTIVLFFVNGHGVQIDALDVNLEAFDIQVIYVDLALNADEHFFELDDHLNATGHLHVADQIVASLF